MPWRAMPQPAVERKQAETFSTSLNKLSIALDLCTRDACALLVSIRPFSYERCSFPLPRALTHAKPIAYVGLFGGNVLEEHHQCDSCVSRPGTQLVVAVGIVAAVNKGSEDVLEQKVDEGLWGQAREWGGGVIVLERGPQQPPKRETACATSKHWQWAER